MMKKYVSLLFIISAISAVYAGVGIAQGASGKNEHPPLYVGGNCQYEKIKGICFVTSVRKIEEQGQRALTGFEAKFTFFPQESLQKQTLGPIQDLSEFIQKEQSEYFSPGTVEAKNVERYHIEKDAVFNCELHAETKGTCTPILFRFQDRIPGGRQTKR